MKNNIYISSGRNKKINMTSPKKVSMLR
jgi:hypothetical protein